MTPRFPDPNNALSAHRAALARAAAADGPLELVLLDLDGTLCDSAAGILASVRHAYEQLGILAPTSEELRSFVGPPMQTSLLAHGVSPDRLDDAMAAYREHYTHAMLDAVVYPGVLDALVALREPLALDGVRVPIVLATSKPEIFAQRIVHHLGLDRHLDAVYGASLDESRLSKGSVIAHALVSEAERTGRRVGPGRAIMVGDRKNDVDGAREHGIDCVGVLWGYGSAAELLDAGAVAVVETPAALVRLLTERHAATPR